MNGAIKTLRLPKVDLSQSTVASWPIAARRAAQEIHDRYGNPNQVTRDALLWYYNSPWKRTVVHRFGPSHGSPYPHTDVLEQTVEYRVPPLHKTELARFSPDVQANAETEELVAHGDSERTNMMLLNLAHDILIGLRTPEAAREMLQALAGALRMNWPEDYAEQLQFAWDRMWSDTVPRHHYFLKGQ